MEKFSDIYKKEPLESYEGMPSYMESVIKNHIAELQNKKEAVVKEFFDKKGYGHLLENIENKRFKRVIVEVYDDCEKWYADNGTDQGELIITFLKPEIFSTQPDGSNFGTSMTTTFKYF